MQVNSTTLKEMLAKIRERHIDIIPIIREELKQIIPPLVKDIIRNVYQIKVVEGK